MRIGVALPTTLPTSRGTTDRQLLLGWARGAEAAGFATLGVLDRLVYDNDEPLTALAFAAAVTERIGLATTVLTPAYRGSAAVLAKQLATLDHLSGGRLTVGVAAGGRADDFTAAGADFDARGVRLDDLLVALRRTWAEARIGPPLGPGGPPLLVGGRARAAVRRAAEHGDGWIGGGGPPEEFAALAEQVRQAWAARGRSGAPRLLTNAYVCLGPDARGTAERYLRTYYAFAPAKVELLAPTVMTEAGQVRETLAGYAEGGCEEVVLLPCAGGLDQLDRIAEAAAGVTGGLVVTAHRT
jgi:alkanesulfonate monooxygenase SsuD/methylene tetrahydromethanopterin reductase-like flavin-dependent oxidoreductase (luciferase family)